MLPHGITLHTDNAYELADGAEALRVTFGGNREELLGYSVTVMADSLLPAQLLSFLDSEWVADQKSPLSPQRVTTAVMRFPRCILAELNTHRVFSRNSASSRARSIKVVIADVMEDPYVPIFTENQKGMGGPIVSLEVQAQAREHWLESRDSAVAGVLSMLLGTNVTPAHLANDGWRHLTDQYYNEVYLKKGHIPGALNLHKQNVNRLLEPFMWHEAVITSTDWENFLELRNHDEADPAIHGLAKLVHQALESSTPVIRHVHAPFASHLMEELEATWDSLSPQEQLMGAVAAANYTSGAAAQVSYRPVGEGGTGADPAKLAVRLLSLKHLSPFEHAAFSEPWVRSLGIRRDLRSNLSRDWVQYRALLAYLQETTGHRELDKVLETLAA